MAITQLLKFRRLVSSAKWCTLEYLVATCKIANVNKEQKRSQYGTLGHPTFEIS